MTSTFTVSVGSHESQRIVAEEPRAAAIRAAREFWDLFGFDDSECESESCIVFVEGPGVTMAFEATVWPDEDDWTESIELRVIPADRRRRGSRA